MKKSMLWRAAALGVAATFALTACGSAKPSATPPPASAPASKPDAKPDANAAEPTAADIAALAAVKIEGKPGKQATATFAKPFSVSAVVSRVVSPGTGEQITSDMTVSVNVVEFNGEDGKVTYTNYDKAPESIPLSKLNPALGVPIAKEKVGARILIAAPPAEGAKASALSLLEIVSAKKPDPVLSGPKGEAVKPAAGLPVVTLDSKGKPSIKIPANFAAPTKLVAQPLIKGEGAVVKATDTITANYSGWTLAGTQFDSSWDRGEPASFSLQQVVKGWTEGLAGQTVGSQVLLVIPADLAYGANPPEGSVIKAGDSLIFVVDILGIG